MNFGKTKVNFLYLVCEQLGAVIPPLSTGGQQSTMQLSVTPPNRWIVCDVGSVSVSSLYLGNPMDPPDVLGLDSGTSRPTKLPNRSKSKHSPLSVETRHDGVSETQLTVQTCPPQSSPLLDPPSPRSC